ncbi:Asparagine synthetase [Pyrenophora tritici-repentis]|nr:Asparagine synthetase [Pyrenophora tritici-repentis]KAF7447635.1 Asparagine synthetase [Pyrenophora tritici-repentis]KAG9385439.1 Asparagine synthetase [Pyrenophora tritici-repentis]
MCGIFACYRHPDVQKFKPTALKMGKAVRHRGPDWSEPLDRCAEENDN